MTGPLRHCFVVWVFLSGCSAGTGGSSSTGRGSSATSAVSSTATGSTTGGGTTGSGATAGGSATGGSSGHPGTLFPADAPWYQDVSAPSHLDPSSAAIINDLAQAGGWGNGNIFQIDFSITLQHALPTTEFVSWTPTADWYSPDCDQQRMPAPSGGAVEGESGYACTQNGDCHLLVIDDAHQRLYELWRANRLGASSWEGGCQAVWDLSKHYAASLRGDGCTSADAAGFPVGALLFTADEVTSGHIDHAIRFILPNARIRHGEYVHPATHSTRPTAGGPNAPPYGVHLRLRADYPVASLPSVGARVVARALQKFGMFLADGGNITLTAADDRFTTAKWSGLLDAHDLASLQVSDFEVVDLGTPVPLGSCTLNP
jgi:hypothetical protein